MTDSSHSGPRCPACGQEVAVPITLGDTEHNLCLRDITIHGSCPYCGAPVRVPAQDLR